MAAVLPNRVKGARAQALINNDKTGHRAMGGLVKPATANLPRRAYSYLLRGGSRSGVTAIDRRESMS